MEKLMSLFEGFEIEKLGELLPSASSLMEGLNRWLALFVLAGPLLMLGFGIYYWFFAPKEANHSMGFRFGYAMSCVEVWQFTQRLAGMAYAGLGLLLTVIIGLISIRFGKMAPPDMVWLAAKCLLWEIVLVIIATLLVDIVVVVLFDIKGNPRSAKTKALTKTTVGKFADRKPGTRKTTRKSTSGSHTPKTAQKPASGNRTQKTNSGSHQSTRTKTGSQKKKSDTRQPQKSRSAVKTQSKKTGNTRPRAHK